MTSLVTQSTRKAMASKAFDLGIPVDCIISQGGWSTKAVFFQYYNWPVRKVTIKDYNLAYTCHFAKLVGHQPGTSMERLQQTNPRVYRQHVYHKGGLSISNPRVTREPRTGHPSELQFTSQPSGLLDPADNSAPPSPDCPSVKKKGIQYVDDETGKQHVKPSKKPVSHKKRSVPMATITTAHQEVVPISSSQHLVQDILPPNFPSITQRFFGATFPSTADNQDIDVPVASSPVVPLVSVPDTVSHDVDVPITSSPVIPFVPAMDNDSSQDTIPFAEDDISLMVQPSFDMEIDSVQVTEAILSPSLQSHSSADLSVSATNSSVIDDSSPSGGYFLVADTNDLLVQAALQAHLLLPASSAPAPLDFSACFFSMAGQTSCLIASSVSQPIVSTKEFISSQPPVVGSTFSQSETETAVNNILLEDSISVQADSQDVSSAQPVLSEVVVTTNVSYIPVVSTNKTRVIKNQGPKCARPCSRTGVDSFIHRVSTCSPRRSSVQVTSASSVVTSSFSVQDFVKVVTVKSTKH